MTPSSVSKDFIGWACGNLGRAADKAVRRLFPAAVATRATVRIKMAVQN